MNNEVKELLEYLHWQVDNNTHWVSPLGLDDKHWKILLDYIDKQKEVLDKIKEYCKNKIEEQKNMTDFSKYYLENYDKAINTQHLSHSGVMLETIKSTTIKRYEDILELLEELND